MADEQHIQWLLEGVEFWNAQRLKGNFNPDLAGMQLLPVFRDAGKANPLGRPRVSLGGINLGSNLDEDVLVEITRPGYSNNPHFDSLATNLAGTDFRGADLANAKFDLADLRGAALAGCNLTGADFTKADLSGADLRGTDLIGANLAFANLNGTHVFGTDLTDAIVWSTNLASTNLAMAEPWKAVLYPPMDISPKQHPDGEEPVKTITDLLSNIRSVKGYHAESLLYFRGESGCGWELRPSVMRNGLISHESAMLIDLVSRRPGEFSGTTSALAQWVLAQHHGLKTRFLDVTKNPLVAMFHACHEGSQDGRIHVLAVPKELVKPFTSDTISVIANFARMSRHDQDAFLGKRQCSICKKINLPDDYQEAKRGLYQLVRAEKPYFDERINIGDLYKAFIVEPQQSSERIRAQASAFLASAFHERFERNEILQWNAGIPIYAQYNLTVSGKYKLKIMEDLRLLNITHETLLPGLEVSAEAVTNSYRPLQSGDGSSCG